MPELPEVETIRRGLAAQIVGWKLHDLLIKDGRLLGNRSEGELKVRIIGRAIEAINRRAKFLILDFGEYSVVIHLRMTGQLSFEKGDHTRLILFFQEAKRLYLDDQRRFATLHLAKSNKLTELKPLRDLGIEPFTKSYTLERFLKLLNSKQEIKRLLLDQRKVAGLGNIYASEVLFVSRIHPQRSANGLTKAEAEELFLTIPEVLAKAIENQGTTISDYRTASGESGQFQELLQVYGLAGENCKVCGSTIEKIEQGGRSSYLCPQCQPI